MDTENHLECKSLGGDSRNLVNGVTDMSPPEDRVCDDVLGSNSVAFNRKEPSEESKTVKSEPEEMETDERYRREDESLETRDLPRERGEQEDASEVWLEEGYDDEEEEEEEEEEDEEEEREGMEAADEGEALSEPQDLSLVDYSRRYDRGSPSVAQAGGYAPGDMDMPAQETSPRSSGSQSGSHKLNCDICGLSCVSINVLLVHKRSHTGERPFHCTQCGASFTQKGNLLRHIKLHSGEKPFKCHMCNYACRRRDALSGHLRTHSVEKPYKCKQCGRSYKQRSSLEEHRERCHAYAQSPGSVETASSAEDSHMARGQMGSDRALLLDKLASNVAKRKSSMPQKFTGDNGVCLDLSFSRAMMQHPDAVALPVSSAVSSDAQQAQALLTAPEHDGPLPQRHYPIQLSRGNPSPLALTNGHKPTPGPVPLARPSAQGHPPGVDTLNHPVDTSPLPQPFVYSLGHLLAGVPNNMPHLHAQALPPPMEALRVLRTEGNPGLLLPPGAVYPCNHCRVIFLDYVMFTIHMGCHGFRDPLECNVCGHRSRDRYEFTSHIARGEHRPEVK
ncbi:hypothetical protein CRUP_034806 [Coryphaenoides rupestris]|nr:hypothetical protein CRUP_034806 [Coryphaenoides rupestris]